MKSYLYDPIYGETIFKKATHYGEKLFWNKYIMYLYNNRLNKK
jgi:hypothetical protein